MAELENKTNEAVENTESPKTETESNKLSFTQEELDALLQKEGDKRVSQALKTAERKNQEKVRESEKLARMNEAEKYEYELEQREKAIAQKELELSLAENKNEASKILAEKGLLGLVDFVVCETADEMNDKIKILEKEFKVAVKNEVEKRLSSSVPKKDLPLDQAITRDSFNKMCLAEQQRLANENPELYKTLTQI